MSTVIPQKKYLRWDEVLKYLDAYGMTISRATLYNWIDTGPLVAVKIRGKLWFTRESVIDIVNFSTFRKIT